MRVSQNTIILKMGNFAFLFCSFLLILPLQLVGLSILSPLSYVLFFKLTVEPSGQVFALHAVMLLAQVPQNHWLCTQEVVERC